MRSLKMQLIGGINVSPWKIHHFFQEVHLLISIIMGRVFYYLSREVSHA